MNKKIVIGITGTLASGKTTVSDMLVELGAVKIDADQIGHDILENDDDIKRRIVEIFGDNIISGGKIDRRMLGGEVFWDKNKLKELNNTLHPAILNEIKNKIDACPEGVIIVDAPLLIETGLHENMDLVVVVVSRYETAMARALKRGITREVVNKIRDNQLSVSEKLEHADYRIDNNGDFNKTKEGVSGLWKKIQDRQDL